MQKDTRNLIARLQSIGRQIQRQTVSSEQGNKPGARNLSWMDLQVLLGIVKLPHHSASVTSSLENQELSIAMKLPTVFESSTSSSNVHRKDAIRTTTWYYLFGGRMVEVAEIKVIGDTRAFESSMGGLVKACF